MPNTTTFANGLVFTSSALATTDLDQIIQTLTLNIFGINPSTDPLAYSKVRVAWQAQPGFTFTDDICSIQTTEDDDAYSIRDRALVVASSATVSQIDTFVRTWGVRWVLYGPSGFDRARLIKSALTLDWTHDELLASNLSVVTRWKRTIRAPEQRDGNWWPRADLSLQMYELVTESIVLPTIASVETKLFIERGQVADITAT
jgi:hypothetical protein